MKPLNRCPTKSSTEVPSLIFRGQLHSIGGRNFCPERACLPLLHLSNSAHGYNGTALCSLTIRPRYSRKRTIRSSKNTRRLLRKSTFKWQMPDVHLVTGSGRALKCIWQTIRWCASTQNRRTRHGKTPLKLRLKINSYRRLFQNFAELTRQPPA